MPPKRNRNKKKVKIPHDPSWPEFRGSGFFPTNVMTGQPMSPYMQVAFGVLGRGNMFGMDYSMPRRDYGDGYYDPSFRVSEKRFEDRSSWTGNNRSRGRNKRPNTQSGSRKKKPKNKKPRPNPPEQEDNEEEAGNDEPNQSSGHGAKAPSRDWKNTNDSQSNFCTVCDQEFTGSFFNHRRDGNHRKNKDKKYPRCRLCRLTFTGKEEYQAHNQTDEHKKMYEDFQVLKQQQVFHAALSDSEDEKTSLQKYISNQEPDNISEDAEPVGLFHVVPMKVYLCKLCQKVFPNYMRGRHIHCRTPAHIQSYKVYFDGKEERAAERTMLKRIKNKEKAARKRQRKLGILGQADGGAKGAEGGAVGDNAAPGEDLDEEDSGEQKEEQVNKKRKIDLPEVEQDVNDESHPVENEEQSVQEVEDETAVADEEDDQNEEGAENQEDDQNEEAAENQEDCEEEKNTDA